MAQTINNPAPVKVNASTYRVESRTAPGTLYTVIRVGGDWQCNCAAAMNDRKCWHVTAVQRKSQDGQRCEARPKAAPPVELGLYLLTGGAQGSR